MSNDLDFLFKPLVLVTGFGPFLNHPVNASWEAVKRINKEELETKHNIELVLLEIPVTYENVDEFVPALWETHTPKGYQRKDYFDKCPANHICTADGAIRLHTKLNVERICKEFNGNSTDDTSAISSKDAGRYLCEYIYYTSLSVDNSRTLFIHVPDIAKYPSQVTAKALEKILELTLEQVIEMDSSKEITEKLRDVNLNNSGGNTTQNNL
ncbi:Pyroglutamyl-peptidase 1 [Papilio machaon]|uniref:Pyroglutamyl-peptidase 1 n=1 Tax=Papilio machaon TaxID=76193 RepID=A0A0N0PAP3_PAPMA|nr:Pyroglutamyl-peptidase 1 [Papilio machaon]